MNDQLGQATTRTNFKGDALSQKKVNLKRLHTINSHFQIILQVAKLQ